ncbi:zinc-binding dehydrogenase [Candidatus Gottesmanbacteria bacterium]|nr:zinc-binding dehydrogenase [Candidatus Gottesmanbacteria bacterium]MBI5452305.1 zinc-binding dehydrogenase [Candidatus Gottesmanbacteria bacterium]
MKAFLLENYQHPPRIRDVPIPIPKRNEVVVKIAYCGVNRVDLAVLSGRFGDSLSFPLIMGSEIVGTLPDGKKVAVNPYLHCGKGRPLLGIQRNGGYAEYVSVPKDNIIPIPQGIALQEACSVTLSAGTAYRMVFNKAKIKAADWVAITAAGSGVGVYSCQLTRLAGANVIALIGNDNKLTKLKALGIKSIVNYRKKNWQKKVEKATDGDGVDILIDTVGGTTLETLIPIIAPLGKIVLCGATENSKINLNLIDLYMKQKQIIGSSGFMNNDLTRIFQLVKENKIKPIIDSVYSLKQIPKAWEKLKSRDVFGKILIKVS